MVVLYKVRFALDAVYDILMTDFANVYFSPLSLINLPMQATNLIGLNQLSYFCYTFKSSQFALLYASSYSSSLTERCVGRIKLGKMIKLLSYRWRIMSLPHSMMKHDNVTRDILHVPHTKY
ncbi:hypothetical protein GGI43DRAFT_122591 [Trichoderma evansii]